MRAQAEYDQWFRSMIHKHVPNLFATVNEREYEDTNWLEAVIPHEEEERVISLSSYGCELTPFISSHHCHFDAFQDDDHEEEFLRAIEWIRGFMNDELFIANEFSGDRIVSSMSTSDRNDLNPSKGNEMKVLTYSNSFQIRG